MAIPQPQQIVDGPNGERVIVSVDAVGIWVSDYANGDLQKTVLIYPGRYDDGAGKPKPEGIWKRGLPVTSPHSNDPIVVEH